jgi:hypothetical protein
MHYKILVTQRCFSIWEIVHYSLQLIVTPLTKTLVYISLLGMIGSNCTLEPMHYCITYLNVNHSSFRFRQLCREENIRYDIITYQKIDDKIVSNNFFFFFVQIIRNSDALELHSNCTRIQCFQKYISFNVCYFRVYILFKRGHWIVN